MLFLFSKIFLVFFILINSANSIDKKWSKKGQYYDWEVYAKAEKDICYAISRPQKMEGAYNLRGRVDVVVALNKNIKNKFYVGFDFGYSFAENSKVSIEIDNRKKFKLSTFGQTAWTGSKIKNDKKIINAMINGNELVALGKSKRGTKTKDIYSLVGFAKAFNEINNYCS